MLHFIYVRLSTARYISRSERKRNHIIPKQSSTNPVSSPARNLRSTDSIASNRSSIDDTLIIDSLDFTTKSSYLSRQNSLLNRSSFSTSFDLRSEFFVESRGVGEECAGFGEDVENRGEILR